MFLLLIQIAALVLACTAIHGAATAGLLVLIERMELRNLSKDSLLKGHLVISFLVLAMLAVSCFEAFLWAAYYYKAGRITDFSESLYFSLVTMTTVGYGDVTLTGQGRTISGVQAALGIVLFGWTTSIIFTAVQAVHDLRRPHR